MAMCGARHQVRRGGSDDDQLGITRESNVIERVSGTKQLSVCAPSGYGLERYRSNELLRATRKDDIYRSTRLGKEARQPDCFVAGDSSRNTKKDAPTVKRTSRSYSGRCRGSTRYSILPRVISSSARVVSFFSRAAVPPGNSLSTREYLAAINTDRYLFAAWRAISPGVNTCILTFSVIVNRRPPGAPRAAAPPAHREWSRGRAEPFRRR